MTQLAIQLGGVFLVLNKFNFVYENFHLFGLIFFYLFFPYLFPYFFIYFESSYLPHVGNQFNQE